MKALLRRAIEPLAAQAARAYVAGPRAGDALRVARRLSAWRLGVTIGYWNAAGESPERVHAASAEGLEAMHRAGLPGYLSLKHPALGPDEGLLLDLLDRARRLGRRVHFDALGPEHADRTNAAIEAGLAKKSDLGTTLPGRWTRSPGDADWAARLGLVVRVVKGQWADPDAPDLDPRAGFLAVVERLAGRAREVAVASHDLALAERSIERLRARGTRVCWELLFGLPLRGARRAARRLRVPVRVYVPFGASWLPYTMDVVRARPTVVPWLVLDRLGL